MANNPQMSEVLRKWQTEELQRPNSLPLKCPNCDADFPRDTVRCPACLNKIGGYWPIIFSASRIGIFLAIVAAVTCAAIRLAH